MQITAIMEHKTSKRIIVGSVESPPTRELLQQLDRDYPDYQLIDAYPAKGSILQSIQHQEDSFSRWAAAYGLPADCLGKLVNTSDGIFRITGIEPKNRKYKVKCIRISDGHMFKSTPESIKLSIDTHGYIQEQNNDSNQ